MFRLASPFRRLPTELVSTFFYFSWLNLFWEERHYPKVVISMLFLRKMLARICLKLNPKIIDQILLFYYYIFPIHYQLIVFFINSRPTNSFSTYF